MRNRTSRRKSAAFMPPLLVLVLSCAGIAGSGNAVAPDIPEVKKNCSLCHREDAVRGAAGLQKPLSDLCLDCHQDRKAPADHKVDIVPSMTVEKLPLTNGRVTCTTCHDPHSNSYGSMLRDRPETLCRNCHKY